MTHSTTQEPVNEIFANWRQLFGIIGGIKPGDNHIIIEREVMPIIFVPGIMGTCLRQRELDSKGRVVKVWDPDNRKFMWKTHIYKKPKNNQLKKLKELLIGEGAHDAEFLTVLNEDDEMGMSNLYQNSYATVLKRLQDFPNDIDNENCRHCFTYPVSAFGYNWTASNAESGKQLKNHIEQVIAQYQQDAHDCQHVILVTHSMGGLVAREACRLLKLDGAEDKVLCVIHGAQPVHGSVAAYSRMKLGVDWEVKTAPGVSKQRSKKSYFSGELPARALGTHGKTVTVKMARMPGALELLPTKRYHSNQAMPQWLHYVNKQTQQCVLSLPKANPYQEIYAEKKAFYRLINPDWLEPWNKTTNANNRDNRLVGEDDKKSAWEEYIDNLQVAEAFHDTLEDYQHPKTYQFYGKDLATVEQVEYGYVQVHAYDKASHVDNQWIVEQRVDRHNWIERIMIRLIDDTGDGTVLCSSARGLKNSVQTARFDTSNTPKWDSVEHQHIYTLDTVIHHVLEAIEGESHARIRQECNLPPEDKKRAEAFEESTADDNADIWL